MPSHAIEPDRPAPRCRVNAWWRLLGAAGRLYPLRRGRSRLANLLLGRCRCTARVAFHGRTLEVVLSQHSSRLVALFGSSEPEEQAVARRLVSEGMLALDVGANIGEYTLILAACVGRSGRVFAFEPDPANCEVLRRNIVRSRMGERIHWEQAALTDYCGEAVLHRDRDAARDTIAPGARLPEPRGSVPVSCLTLDRFAERESLHRLDFLKIDAEGAELSILRGGRKVLTELGPTVMAEVRGDLSERFGIESDEVWDFMRSLGYVAHTAARGRLLAAPGRAARTGNIFFMRGSATALPIPR